MNYIRSYLRYSLLMVLLSAGVVLSFAILAIVFNTNGKIHFDIGGLGIAFLLLSGLGLVSNTFAFGTDMIKKED